MRHGVIAIFLWSAILSQNIFSLIPQPWSLEAPVVVPSLPAEWSAMIKQRVAEIGDRKILFDRVMEYLFLFKDVLDDEMIGSSGHVLLLEEIRKAVLNQIAVELDVVAQKDSKRSISPDDGVASNTIARNALHGIATVLSSIRCEKESDVQHAKKEIATVMRDLPEMLEVVSMTLHKPANFNALTTYLKTKLSKNKSKIIGGVAICFSLICLGALWYAGSKFAERKLSEKEQRFNQMLGYIKKYRNERDRLFLIDWMPSSRDIMV